MNDVWIYFWWGKLCIIWKWVFCYQLWTWCFDWTDKIVWLYGGDELSASWLGLILVSCRGCWWNPRLWLFGYWCGQFEMSDGEIKCMHDWPTLRLKGQLIMSWACVIGSSWDLDRDQKVDSGGGDISAADLMASTPRQVRPEINPVVTVGWRPTNWGK